MHEAFEKTFAGDILNQMEREYLEGDQLSFHSAIRLCSKHNIAFPPWVRERLLKDAEDALEKGKSGKGTRGKSNPGTTLRIIRERKYVKACLLACSNAGFKSEPKQEKAAELLELVGVYREESTLKSPKGLKKLEISMEHYEPFRKALGLKEDYLGYLVLDDVVK